MALSVGFNSLLFIDENARKGETFFDFKVLRDFPVDIQDNRLYMPAAGYSHKRHKQVELINSAQKSIATIVSKSATIGVGAKLSAGCFVSHHAHLAPWQALAVVA